MSRVIAGSAASLALWIETPGARIE